MENRVIKFRAWSPDNNEMYLSDDNYFFHVSHDSIGFYPRVGTEELSHFNTKPDEHEKLIHVMQFTGLTDKNGKEIYEGDVLRFWNGKIGEVVYDFLDVIVDDNDRADILCFCIRIGKHRACIESTDEVIGNVFQHSNLLK